MSDEILLKSSDSAQAESIQNAGNIPLDDFELIKQGAEARVYFGKLKENGRSAIVKERFKKTYRQPDLDKSLTIKRIKNEVKLLKKAAGLGRWLRLDETIFEWDDLLVKKRSQGAGSVQQRQGQRAYSYGIYRKLDDNQGFYIWTFEARPGRRNWRDSQTVVDQDWEIHRNSAPQRDHSRRPDDIKRSDKKQRFEWNLFHRFRLEFNIAAVGRQSSRPLRSRKSTDFHPFETSKADIRQHIRELLRWIRPPSRQGCPSTRTSSFARKKAQHDRLIRFHRPSSIRSTNMW